MHFQRPNNLGRSTFEAEPDPFKRLAQLDAWFRSRHLGTQLQALSLFPHLLNEFPFPVLITSGILKLADFFSSAITTNLLRVYIYKAFKQSRKHLTKVTNVEVLVKSILPIVRTNDRDARILALKVFDCISDIVSDRLDVLHSVLLRLDALGEPQEINAAIGAADRLCAKSEIFPAILCDPIASKLKDPNIDERVKIKLLKLLKHMHRDLQLASKARKTCLEFLERTDTSMNTICVILKTLTFLSSKALVYRKKQVDLLFEYALHDMREYIRLNALACLRWLVRDDLALEEEQALKLLHLACSNSEPSEIRTASLRALQVILRRTIFAQSLVLDIPNLLALMERSRDLKSLPLEEQDVYSHVLCLLAEKMRTITEETGESSVLNAGQNLEKILSTILQQYCEAIEKWAIGIDEKEPDENVARIKSTLKTILPLALLSEKNADRTCQILVQMIASTRGQNLLCLGKCLHALTEKYHAIPLNNYELICSMLKKILNDGGSGELRPLFIPLFRAWHTAEDVELKERISKELESAVNQLGGWDGSGFVRQFWELFCVSLEAGKAGHFKLMQTIIDPLSKMVETEGFHYWLTTLSCITEAEVSIQSIQAGQASSTAGILNNAAVKYIKAMNSLDALGAIDQPRLFQKWYCLLRCDFLKHLQRVFAALSRARRSGNWKELGRVAQAEAINLNELARNYFSLAHSFLDIDNNSMVVLETYQSCCLSLGCVLTSLLDRKSLNTLISPLMQSYANAKSNSADNDTLSYFELLSQICDENAMELDDIGRVDELERLLCRIVSLPLQMPAFFFVHRRRVKVQLTTDPRDDQPFVLKQGCNLVWKLEGIVHVEGGKGGIDRLKHFREVEVTCVVSRERPGGAARLSEQLTHQEGQSRMVFRVPIVNGYFECICLVPIPEFVEKKRRPIENGRRGAPVEAADAYVQARVGFVGEREEGRIVWGNEAFACLAVELD
ncbi:uncharacterized protein VTP21DRAFT_11623 [Calcarisporiella thermophila]|uniref:uncharacterized protein n=1 Tax=Calcarisporiella thermophila TaxID=911321 RepID=UPI003742A130